MGFAYFELSDKEKMSEMMESNARVAALVGNVSEKQTKNGETIAILTLQDKSSKLEAFCGAKRWEALKEKIYEGSLIMASGKLTISSFNNRPQLMVNSIDFLEEKIKQAKTFYINVDSDFFSPKQNADLEKFFEERNKEKGVALCFIVSGKHGYQYKMETGKYKIPSTRESLKSLVSVFGKRNVWVGG
jgi:DNA polymerase-3 subunit alpha